MLSVATDTENPDINERVKSLEESFENKKALDKKDVFIAKKDMKIDSVEDKLIDDMKGAAENINKR